MKISIDGGALCSPGYKRFGTYTFSSNVISAIAQYDSLNTYYIYSFCNKPSQLMLTNNMFFKVLRPKLLWMKARVTVEELTARKDVYLALNQAIPLYTKSKIISFSHGLSFVHFPRLYGYGYIQLLNQLKTLIKRADIIVVSSERVKNEMIMKYPNRKDDIVVLPFGIPYDFQTTNIKKKQPYFLYVGSNHPIKNVQFLVEAFHEFNQKNKKNNFELYLVGPFNGLKKKYRNVKVFTKMPRLKLQSLYQQATAYLSASLYESFNLPVLEALSQDCPVIGLESAIIPEFISFCTVVNNKEEFIESMTKATVLESKSVDLEKLRDKFSWEKYIKTLRKCY